MELMDIASWTAAEAAIENARGGRAFGIPAVAVPSVLNSLGMTSVRGRLI